MTACILEVEAGNLENDDLTGLPGRRWLQQQLISPLPEGWQRGVVVLDVDAFSLVNRGYGPDAGDRVLQQLAGRLQLLSGQRLLGRWHADEFVCIIDAVQPAEAMDELMCSLSAVTDLAFQVGEERLRLSLSCGLATSESVRVQDLFPAALTALDAAKARGRDRAEWFDPTTARLLDSGGLRLANDLHHGIADDELRLYLQPIVDLSTNDITGAEALVRWQRPGVGLVQPGEFIDVAERTGQIAALSEWVAREACHAAVDLAGWGPDPLRVSINISARQLSDRRLPAMLSHVLADTGCPPEQLAIEVTETAVLHDLDGVTVVLEAIKDLGIGLDLDDFGTGFSSLTHLKHFPVDRIKIDGSFVQGLGTDPADTAIVASTISLAHSMGVAAVAEGVTTDAQLELLRGQNCDFAQGFLLSRAVPLARLHDWLATRSSVCPVSRPVPVGESLLVGPFS